MKKKAGLLLSVIICVVFFVIFSLYRPNAYKDIEQKNEARNNSSMCEEKPLTVVDSEQ